MPRLQKWLDDPTFHVRFNLAAVVLLLVLLPPTLTSWRDSVTYLVFLSWWALFGQHLTGFVAAKAEVKAGETNGIQ